MQFARGSIPTTQIILSKKSLKKTQRGQRDSNSSYKYENITTEKLTTQQNRRRK